MFSIVTVASSTRMPTASASPPSVMTLSVSPIADSATIEPSAASGMDVAMMSVERQLPRNSKIIRLVSAAAMAPSRATPDIAARTNRDWSPSKLIWRCAGSASAISASFCLTPEMIARVDAEPLFNTCNSTDRSPLT